jgi:dihydrodipicolinate synthase/N-acetylneuraminate lyase
LAARGSQPYTVIIGNDCMFARGRRAGAPGVISGVAGAFPELMCALEHAIASGDPLRAAQMEKQLAECLSWLDRYPVPMALKRALHLRGLRMGPDALPMGDAFRPFDEWFPGFLAAVQEHSRLRFQAA